MAGNDLSQRDLKEVSDACGFAVSKENDMAKLKESVGDMGSISLWLDAKGFFNKSDPKLMTKELEKYREYYSAMKTAFQHARDGDEDAENLLSELQDLLTELLQESKKASNSKTVCRVQSEFTSKHLLLENKIKRVENVVVRQQLRKARKDWQEAVQEIRDVKEELKHARNDNTDLAKKFDRLMKINEESLAQQQALREENELIRALLEKLVAGDR